MAKKVTTGKDVADAILHLSYDEMISLAEDLAEMQRSAKEDADFRWKPTEAHGNYGIAQMLYSWAESQ